jgi:hypothetical protein
VGCNGDGDRDMGFADVDGVEGAIGKYALDVGETGVSSKLDADLLALMLMGFDEDNASKALILDLISSGVSSDNI